MDQTVDKKTKQKDASRVSMRKKRAFDSTVEIPKLTKRQKAKRAQLEADSEAWIWEMCGPRSGILEPLTRMFTSQQSQMIGAYEETLKHGGDELLLASRGEGKTTYLRAMVWKSIAQGLVDFAAFISATGLDADHSSSAIRDMIERSVTFAKLYPEIAIPCGMVGSTPQLARTMNASGYRFDNDEPFDQIPISFSWSSAGLDFPDVPGSPSARAMLRFRGADSPIRGLNILGRRPKVIAIDDLDTPDTTEGRIENAKKIVDRVNFDIGGLGTQTHSLARIMLATLPKQGCGVAHTFATTGHPFVVRRFKYLEEKPDRMDLWLEYVNIRQKGKIAGDKYGRLAHRFYLKNQSDMDAGAVISNVWRFKPQVLPDGSKLQISALQNYFDEWADKGEMFCRCELDNEIVESDVVITSSLEMGHVSQCEGNYYRNTVDESTTMIVRGIDVRKTELHFSSLASDDLRRHRVTDYDVRSHGTSETTVEQAEELILAALHKLADEWDENGCVDQNGGTHSCNLTLVDKGWMGNWREDGEVKTWASQPVEQFCMERGLRRWLPAKGQPAYRSPVPSREVLIGENWHINKGKGSQRICSEVIWNADHYHALVEGLFLLSETDSDRFSLPIAEKGVWTNHKRLADHIFEGAQELAESKRKASQKRKPKFRRDHWWDSFAMMLVAKSVDTHLRELDAKKKPQISLAEMAARNR